MFLSHVILLHHKNRLYVTSQEGKIKTAERDFVFLSVLLKNLAFTLNLVACVPEHDQKSGPSTRFTRNNNNVRPEKKFSQEIFQSEDDSSIIITSKIDTKENKISLSKTFQIQCSSSYAHVFYHFFVTKRQAKTTKKSKTQQISTPI